MNRLIVFFIALVFLSGLAYSQSRDTGAIEGKVVDSEGNPLPGVEVKLLSPDMIGGARSKITDASGRFRYVGLQPGVYTVEASLEGFTSTKREEIGLHIGKTLTITVELKIATLEEEITVIAVSPLIDVKDSAVGIAHLDTQFLENIPDRRRRTSYMIDLAPGVIGHAAFGAAGRSANSYTLDGVETDYPASGSCWSMVDFNVFQELEVLGLGAGAEWDGFQGIVMNAVSKSGGNEFEGHVEFFYQDWNWESTTHIDWEDPSFQLIAKPRRSRELDTGFSLGGPILKDKLWFFGAARYRRMDREIRGYPEHFNLYLPKGFFKLTFQPSINDRLTSFFEYDLYYNPRSWLGIFRPPDCAGIEWGPVYMFNIHDLHTFTDKTFLELKLAGYWAPYNQEPNQGMDIPEHVDDRTGMVSGNYGGYYYSYANRYSAYATLSHHADDFIKGSHDFKFGVEIEHCPAKDESGYTGGYLYRDYVKIGDEYHFFAYSSGSYDRTRYTRISGFIQDNWKISDNFTINPGIRYHIYRGWVESVGETVFNSSSYSPRIGFTWDVFGDHSTALKAHYGMYSSGMKLGYFDRASKGLEDYVEYEVMPDGTKVEIYRADYSTPHAIDPDIKYPYMDQFTAGIERELMKDMSLGATFIWRKWHSYIVRVNRGATWEKVPFTFTDDKGAQQTIDVYRKTSPSAADDFYITNVEEGDYDVFEPPKASYIGLMFTLNKRFSNKWMLNASYLWCQQRGTQLGGSSARNYTNLNTQINSYGPLGYDPTHQVKIYATIILPFDISFSPSFLYITGDPWTRRVRATAASPKTTINIEERGSTKRPPETINLDFRFEKFFNLGPGRLGFVADVMNALNRGVATWYESRVDRGTFDLITGTNPGRLIRLAVRYLF